MAVIERVAKRVLIDIHPRSIYRKLGWDEPKVLIGIALETLKIHNLISSGTQNDESDIRLIIKSISRHDTRIVFDIFHDTYDATQAHLYGQDPPVIIVSMRRKERVKAYPANPFQEFKVNFEIRFLHNRYGIGSQPSFSEDSRQGCAWSILLKDFRNHAEFLAQQDHLIEAEKQTTRWVSGVDGIRAYAEIDSAMETPLRR